jgi:transcriptional regulator with XRE-family HTH domain
MSDDAIETPSLDDLFALGEGGSAIAAPQRSGALRHTETLRASLDRVVGKHGFLASDGVTPAALDLGINLKRARLAKKLTQEKLAERVGLSQAALSAIENGRGKDGPTWATIARICEALEIEPSFLPAGAIPAESDPVAVRFFAASKRLNAPVRAAALEQAAAEFAISLLSSKKQHWISNSLKKAAFGPLKRPRKGDACLWSLASHTGTRITTDGPLVLITMDKAPVEMRGVVRGAKTPHVLIYDNIALVGAQSMVEIGNMSNQGTIVFGVPAGRLVKDAVDSA